VGLVPVFGQLVRARERHAHFRSHRVAQSIGASSAADDYFFFVVRSARTARLTATAARISCLNAVTLIFSPSRTSMARRTFPSRSS